MIDKENITEKHESVMTVEKMIETTSESIINFISSFLKIDKNSIREQFENLYDSTKYEIITNILLYSHPMFPIDQWYQWLPKNKIVLTRFLEDIFEKPMVHISDFYKQLSEKFNGKYSPEELELICECEKQLVCSLLEKNDIIETKSCLYDKRYDEDGDPIDVSISPHADIVDTIKRLSTISKLQKTSIATEI